MPYTARRTRYLLSLQRSKHKEQQQRPSTTHHNHLTPPRQQDRQDHPNHQDVPIVHFQLQPVNRHIHAKQYHHPPHSRHVKTVHRNKPRRHYTNTNRANRGHPTVPILSHRAIALVYMPISWRGSKPVARPCSRHTRHGHCVHHHRRVMFSYINTILTITLIISTLFCFRIKNLNVATASTIGPGCNIHIPYSAGSTGNGGRACSGCTGIGIHILGNAGFINFTGTIDATLSGHRFGIAN